MRRRTRAPTHSQRRPALRRFVRDPPVLEPHVARARGRVLVIDRLGRQRPLVEACLDGNQMHAPPPSLLCTPRRNHAPHARTRCRGQAQNALVSPLAKRFLVGVRRHPALCFEGAAPLGAMFWGVREITLHIHRPAPATCPPGAARHPRSARTKRYLDDKEQGRERREHQRRRRRSPHANGQKFVGG